jgi:zinc-finger binding domain of transposase IS66/Transposase C of IS166 homeodomain
MELQLEELGANAAEDEAAAAKATALTRRKPARKPFPAHLPRERVVLPGPAACACCGSTKLAKLGEDVTETLEVVPRQWKVVQYVREKFTCRDCEKVTQVLAPFHVLPRGFAGPSLLAMILFEKYGQHQPLNLPRPSCRPRPQLRSSPKARDSRSASRPSPCAPRCRISMTRGLPALQARPRRTVRCRKFSTPRSRWRTLNIEVKKSALRHRTDDR